MPEKQQQIWINICQFAKSGCQKCKHSINVNKIRPQNSFLLSDKLYFTCKGWQYPCISGSFLLKMNMYGSSFAVALLAWCWEAVFPWTTASQTSFFYHFARSNICSSRMVHNFNKWQAFIIDPYGWNLRILSIMIFRLVSSPTDMVEPKVQTSSQIAKTRSNLVYSFV